MSFGIEIVKDAEGVHIAHVSGVDNIPEGTLSVSGHTPTAGTSPAATLAVTLSKVDANGYRQHLASASASYVVAVSPAP